MTEIKMRDALRTLTGLLLLGAFFFFIDLSKVLSEVLSADLNLYVLASLLFFSTYVATALRWQNLVSSVGCDFGFVESLKTLAIAYGFNQLLPGNSGDLARSKIMENYTGVEKHSKILGTVVLERFYDAFFVTGIILIAANFVAASYMASAAWLLKLFTGLLAGFLVALVVLEFLELRLPFLPDRVEKELGKLHEGMTSTSTSTTFYNLVLTGYKWTAEIAVFYILAVSLSLELGIWEAAFVTSAMSLVSSLPITPAGLGPVEITGTGLLRISGISLSGAASLVVLQRSIGVVLTAALGTLVYLIDFRGQGRRAH